MKQLLLAFSSVIISVFAFAQPVNNLCSGAIGLTSNTTCITSNGTLAAATYTGVTGPCGASSGNRNDVWYRFVAPTASLNITVAGALTAPRFQVYSQSSPCTGLASIFCSTSGTGNVTGLTVGVSYLIRIYCDNNSNTTFTVCLQHGAPLPTRTNEVFRETIIANTQANISPWEIAYEDQEDSLWITEQREYVIRKMHPSNGGTRVILNLAENGSFPNFRRTFGTSQNPWPQGGLMGLVTHPQFLTGAGKDYVYVAYVRDFVGAGPGNSAGTRNRTVTNTDNGGEVVRGDLFRTFIVRFTYNNSTKALESPVAVCDTVTGSSDHNSGRLAIAPMTPGGTDYFLFYSCGDMGAGQFYCAERTYKSQETNSYEGKILRFNLEEDNDLVQNVGVRSTNYNRFIPNDNPYNNIAPVTGQSAVWSIGHRNVQGFAYTNGRLYGSSHGPFSDDEVNFLQGNRNYGHPRIIGKQSDNNYNGSKAAHNFTGWGNEHSSNPLISTLPQITTETGTALTNYSDPVYSFFDGVTGTAITSVVNGIYNAGQFSPNGAWPSIAPSGMDAYNNIKIPGWRNTLFLASLKRGYIMRIKPNSTGTGVDAIGSADTAVLFNRQNRYRDIAFDSDGWSIYAAVDSSGSTSGPTATTPVNSACPGCIIKYTFLGYNPTGTTPFPSTIPTYIPIDSASTAPTPPGCVTATQVSIRTADNNTNLWVPITGPNGNIIAEIKANGNDLGDVTTSFYTRNNSAIRTGSQSKYMNRNVTINVAGGITPRPYSTPVSVRLYVTDKELKDMINGGVGVAGLNDVGVFKNNDPCGAAIQTVPSGQVVTARTAQSSFGHVIQFNVDNFSSFYFFNVSSTLPFELFTFTGKPVNDASKLEWVVGSQTDVTGYTVERSLDNINFESITTVQMKNGGEKTTYNYTDFNAAKLGTIIYYRIRSNETTGTGKYSNIISVNFGTTLITSVSLMPNPVTNKTTVIINAVADETAQLKVVDNTGRIIRVMNVSLVKGKNNISLDVSNFKPGLYYIDVNGKAISEKTKLIKH
jgi:trimeric autotransporter adhesin